MSNIVFPDGSSPLFNPAAYGEASVEARTRKSGAGRSKKDKTERAKKGFSAFFEKAALGGVRELPRGEDSYGELLDEVHHAGTALAQRPFPPEIRAYREAVRDFVHYVVENSFDTEEQTSLYRRGKLSASGTAGEAPAGDPLKMKKFTLIKVIDERLEKMAAGILRGQSAQLEILSRLDEIKGLLVDLMQ